MTRSGSEGDSHSCFCTFLEKFLKIVLIWHGIGAVLISGSHTDPRSSAVMLFGVFYNRIRYKWTEYFCVLLVSGGVGLFFLSNKVSEMFTLCCLAGV